jgi:hypothetical protein
VIMLSPKNSEAPKIPSRPAPPSPGVRRAGPAGARRNRLLFWLYRRFGSAAATGGTE